MTKDIRDAFFDELYEIASKDHDVLFLTADMGAFSLEKFRKELPRQFINVGVAEQNMVSVAAGLCLGGKKVFIYSIAAFATERCFEQIKVDLCLMNLPVVVIGAGPGLTYAPDGPTHQSPEDIAIMRSLPGMTILSPSDQFAAEAAARIAYGKRTPVYVRLDKGSYPPLYAPGQDMSAGIARLLGGKDLVIIATGLMTHRALEVSAKLREAAIDTSVIDLFQIKPLNQTVLLGLLEGVRAVVTLEEHTIAGGIGSIVAELLADEGVSLRLKRIGIPDEYCGYYGSRDWLHAYFGLDSVKLATELVAWRKDRDPKGAGIEITGNHSVDRHLRVDDAINLLGSDGHDFPHECREIVAQCDFAYRLPSSKERDEIILNVLKKIDSSELTASGKDRQDQWDTGWHENLENFVRAGYDIGELVPKYYRPNRVIRLNREYAISKDDRFEYSLFRVLRHWIYSKYLKNAAEIFEFGCGSGHNLPVLATMFPGKGLHGLDWVRSSVEIVDLLARKYGWNITGHLFDMFLPDASLEVRPGSAFVTFGALEQLGDNFRPFVGFVLKKSPALCVNVEPLWELYDQGHLVDYLALCFHRKRGYLGNLIGELNLLETQGKVTVLDVRRIPFGGPFHDGWSLVVWKPLPDARGI